MNDSIVPNQTLNVVGAILGAFTGLAITLNFQHEAMLASIGAAALIVFLGQIKPRGAKAIVLCGVLGLACTRLTLSLIQ